MKILHVVTLITPDGAYGGPARVAVNQATGLIARGHSVELIAATAGFDEPPKHYREVPVSLFPARRVLSMDSFAATWAPGMWQWLTRNGRRFDIAHIHLARDLVSTPAALMLRHIGIPYICQTHGMIRHSNHPLAKPLDRVFIRRVLADAQAVLCLNVREQADVAEITGPATNLRVLPNGVPKENDLARVSPGQQLQSCPEVLFLARLHPRKRPEVFAEAALQLLREGRHVKFTVVGPAEGSEPKIDEFIALAAAEGFGRLLSRETGVAPSEVNHRMAQASVYVLPAEREPFGLTIVEALAQAVPVVISDDGGLVDFVTRNQCGICVDGSPKPIARAIRYLLDNPEAAKEMGRRGAAAVAAELSNESVNDRLEAIYRSAEPASKRR